MAIVLIVLILLLGGCSRVDAQTPNFYTFVNNSLATITVDQVCLFAVDLRE